MEGDRFIVARGYQRINFYPRPRVEGDGSGIGITSLYSQYFYPRPRVEGDLRAGYPAPFAVISTHALA